MNYRLFCWLLILCVGAMTAAAQDDDEDAGTSEPVEQNEGNAGDEEAVEIDDESYIDIDQEDFTPSEEIPTDESIPFPTDI